MAGPRQEIVVLVTTGSEEEALSIARHLVEKKLVACANLVPRVRSVFRWEGKVSEETETLMLLKSRQELFDDLVTAIKSVHSYQVPEIIAIPLVKGAEPYLSWLNGELRGRMNSNT